MIIKRGNIWENNVLGNTDILTFTCNSQLSRKEYRLIMGAGFAKDIKDRFAGIDYKLGEFLLKKYIEKKEYAFGFVVIPFGPFQIGAFQTKFYHYKPSYLSLILWSCWKMREYLREHPEIKRVDMNYPGIGQGGLSVEEVNPILEEFLPDTVNVWIL